MPKVSGVAHQRALKAFHKAGFEVKRQGKHIIMSDGKRTIQIPRHDPLNAYTLASIVRDAGLSVDEFRKLL